MPIKRDPHRELLDDISGSIAAPEKSMWAAALVMAINDSMGRLYIDYVSEKYRELYERQAMRSAREWIFEWDTNEIGSFTWVCDHLGLRPYNIRKYILENVTKEVSTYLKNYVLD